jgi:competence protein ComEC
MSSTRSISLQLDDLGDSARSQRYTPLLTIGFAFAVGIGLDLWLAIPVSLSWLTVLGALLVWQHQWRRSHFRTSTLSLLIAIASLGAASHHDAWRWYADDEIGLRVTTDRTPIAIDGTLLAAPVVLPAPSPTPLSPFQPTERTRLELRIASVRHRDQWQHATGEATTFVDGVVTSLKPGSKIRLFGFASRIAPPSNPGEPDFAAMARREHRLVRVQAEFAPCVTQRHNKASQRGLFEWPNLLIAHAREHFRQILNRHVSPERAPLASALLLGTRESLSYEEQQRFLLTGTIHLLAISGMNLAILAWGIAGFVRLLGLSRRKEILLVGGFAIGYAALTGAEPPVVRAAVIVVGALLARWLQRGDSSWNTLALAALIILATNPTQLFSLGTQLSFIAVAVLNATSTIRFGRAPEDPLDRLIWRTRPWWHRILRACGYWLLQVTVVGLVIWFFTQPLSWLHFHVVSPVAIPLNLVAAIPTNLALLFGFFALITDLIGLPWLPDLFGWACSRSLDALDVMVRFAEWGPPAYGYVPAPPVWCVTLLYGVWTIGCMVWTIPRRVLVATSCLWLAVMMGLTLNWLGTSRPQSPRLTFISVGHGLATLIELPQGQTILYDSGRLGQPEPVARVVSNALLSRGKTRLDAIVISHADLDHYNAIPELVNRFDVGVVYVSAVMFNNQTPALMTLQSAIAAKGIPLKTLRAGDRLSGLGDTQLEVLHPGRRAERTNDNANSIVLQLEHKGRRALLTGDLEGPGLASLLNETPRQVDLLLAPHHGSRNSNPFGLSQWATPRLVVISGGAMDEGDASNEVVIAYTLGGADVWHTYRDGAVTIELDSALKAAGHRNDVPFFRSVR